jgi:enoyl-[acyl-carrier protein] reductase II
MLRTRLTDALQIEHPVMLAGMGGVSYHRLVTAVSDAGGFGCMGASTMSAEDIRTEIAAVTGATGKPFGVDLLTAVPQGLEAKVRDIIAGGATAFVAGLGVPRDVVDMCHASGLLVVNMCGKVRHAVEAVEAGCDIVVAQTRSRPSSSASRKRGISFTSSCRSPSIVRMMSPRAT